MRGSVRLCSMPEETRLTLKQRRFADAWLTNGGNGATAAREAGYRGSSSTLAQVAYENLRKPEIRAYIDARLAAETATAAEALSRLTAMARGSLGDVLRFDEDGGWEVDLDQARERGRLQCVKKVRQHPIEGLTIEIHNPVPALKLLGDFHGLWKQPAEAAAPVLPASPQEDDLNDLAPDERAAIVSAAEYLQFEDEGAAGQPAPGG